MIRRRWTYLLPLALAIPLAAACGNDSGDGSTNAGGTGATDGGAGSGATAGGGAGGVAGGQSGGAAGSGASGGTGGSGATAGSGTGGSTGFCSAFASVTSDAACKSYSAELCNVFSTCGTFYYTWFHLADEAECKTQFELACKIMVESPGSGVKAAYPATVAEHLSKMTCDDWFSGAFDAIEKPVDASCGGPGTVADGNTCYSGAQCQSEHCEVPDGVVCGQCKTQQVGDACILNTDCADGQHCGADDTCALDKQIGESCPPFSDCVEGAYCSANDVCVAVGGVGADCTASYHCEKGMVCSSTGKCKKPALGTAGASCDPDELHSCNDFMHFHCDATQKCVQATTPGPGQACTGATGCSGGAACFSGTCVANADVGGACNETTGPRCTHPVACVSGSCTLPSSTSCPN